jgi:hypothetical protein
MDMKKVTKEELNSILELHKKWLKNKEGGKRADLSSADLSSADLSSADLSSADLSSADLSSANLRYANLRYANLSSADLSYADLRYADLSSANLSSANLSSANLSSADLSSANLDTEYIHNAAGNGKEIKSMQLENDMKITYKHDYITFGCAGYSFDEWLKLEGYDSPYWGKYRDLILKIVETSPAIKPEKQG